jgi:polar amino acid transport system substrate-binding protein
MKLIPIFLILVLSSSVQAATYKIFTAAVPPLVEKNGEGVEGFGGLFGKIVADKIQKSGQAAEFEVTWVPWKRALSETKAKNAIFFPLARTAEREKEFSWLGHLGTVESWFYTTNPKIKIESLQDLKKFRIGFMNGSMREAELRKILGDNAANMDGLTEDLGNFKKLITGRIDIWATQTEVFEKGLADYKEKNKSMPKVYAVRKFLDQDIWLVSGVGMDEKKKEKIRTIFKTNKTDTEIQRTTASELLGAP